MKTVFIDTSGWLAIVNSTDFLHTRASNIYQDLLKTNDRFVSHEAILLELGNSLSSIKTRKLAVNLDESIRNSKRIELVPISSEVIEAGWKLYAERLDKNWGIVDCISFIVMEKFGITEALTADKHFEQAGFVKLL
jgi:uncharacterized protein